MSDALLVLQNDVTDKLNSEAYFNYISVVSLRKEVIKKEIEKKAPHVRGKNGKKGLGILVGMPATRRIDKDVGGLQDQIILPIDIIEQPEINFLTNGTQITAEEAGRAVRRHLHHFQLEGFVFLYDDDEAMQPIEGIEQLYPNCVGYRDFLRCQLRENSPNKTLLPLLTEDALTVTLTNITAGATIYYTTDDSFPGSANSNAHVYAAPFAVTSGTVVRWAAYKTGMQGSDVGRATVT